MAAWGAALCAKHRPHGWKEKGDPALRQGVLPLRLLQQHLMAVTSVGRSLFVPPPVGDPEGRPRCPLQWCQGKLQLGPSAPELAPSLQMLLGHLRACVEKGRGWCSGGSCVSLIYSSALHLYRGFTVRAAPAENKPRCPSGCLPPPQRLVHAGSPRSCLDWSRGC